MNFTRNSFKMSFFPGDFEGAKSLQYSNLIRKQGMIIGTLSCQRVGCWPPSRDEDGRLDSSGDVALQVRYHGCQQSHSET